MKCKVCGRDVFKHSVKDVIDCLKEAGFDAKKDVPTVMASKTGTKVTVNYRQQHILYEKGEIQDSQDMHTDILRVCLTGKNIPDMADEKQTKKTNKKEEE